MSLVVRLANGGATQWRVVWDSPTNAKWPNELSQLPTSKSLASQSSLRLPRDFFRLVKPWVWRSATSLRNGVSNRRCSGTLNFTIVRHSTLSPYSEIARRLQGEMSDRAMSVEQMSEEVGWELAEYLSDPDRLSELPIYGLRWVCKAANVDWATTLSNPTARLTTRCT